MSHSPLMMDGDKMAFSSKPFATITRAGVSVYLAGDTPSISFVKQAIGPCGLLK